MSSAVARSPTTDPMPSAAPPRAVRSAAAFRPFCGAFIPAPTDPSKNATKPVRSAHNAARGQSRASPYPQLPRSGRTTIKRPQERLFLPMPDEIATDPEREFDMTQRDVLYFLTNPEDCQPVWSVEDLGRALDNPVGAVDAVGALRRAGLIHQTSDGHVFATRSGIRMVQIVGRVA